MGFSCCCSVAVCVYVCVVDGAVCEWWRGEVGGSPQGRVLESSDPSWWKKKRSVTLLSNCLATSVQVSQTVKLWYCTVCQWCSTFLYNCGDAFWKTASTHTLTGTLDRWRQTAGLLWRFGRWCSYSGSGCWLSSRCRLCGHEYIQSLKVMQCNFPASVTVIAEQSRRSSPSLRQSLHLSLLSLSSQLLSFNHLSSQPTLVIAYLRSAFFCLYNLWPFVCVF